MVKKAIIFTNSQTQHWRTLWVRVRLRVSTNYHQIIRLIKSGEIGQFSAQLEFIKLMSGCKINVVRNVVLLEIRNSIVILLLLRPTYM